MIISYEWLKSLLPGLTSSPEEIATALTLHSFETTVGQKRVIDPNVVIVRIEKIEIHPNADRLRLATVTDGKSTTQVVCGAANIYEGAVVPFSPPGTNLYDQDGKLFTLTPATIRGVESPGMLNSLRELGIGNSHSGIYILPPDIPVGTKLRDLLSDDVILEADITRNRAHDCLSMRGIARELGAILDVPLNEGVFPQGELVSQKGEWTFATETPDEVTRYIGIAIDNVAVVPSPLWLQARILSLGSRPINNVVDVTNYVMYELGNPSHAFDADQLPGKNIGARFAKEDEPLQTLDDVTRVLQQKNLVITSEDHAVAVAGVIGGSGAQVTKKTTKLFIEVANFAPYTVQQSAQQLSLRTEASNRFTKSIDSSLTEQAAQRIIALLTEITGGTVTQVVDYNPRPRKVHAITFNPKRLAAIVGAAIAPVEAERILTALRCRVNTDKKIWLVSPPVERLDLEGEHDLIEEVLRLYGLEKLHDEAPSLPPQPSALPTAVAWREVLRDRLIALGMTETYNYSFSPGVLALQLGENETQALRITNPIAPELSRLRQTLLPGLLQNIHKNKGEVRIQRLFEIGTVFSRGNGGVVAGVREKLILGGAVVAGESGSDIFVQMAIDNVQQELGITDVTTQSETNDALGEHTVLYHKGKKIGYFGVLAPAIRRKLKLESRVAVFEVDLGILIQIATNEPKEYLPPTAIQQYQPFSKYPPVWRDVSLLVAPDVSIENIQQIIERAGGDMVVDVDLFDVYQPSPEPSAFAKPTADKTAGDATQPNQEKTEKNVAFHIKYQSSEKTLTDDEVAARHNEIVATLKTQLGAQIRE